MSSDEKTNHYNRLDEIREREYLRKKAQERRAQQQESLERDKQAQAFALLEKKQDFQFEQDRKQQLRQAEDAERERQKALLIQHLSFEQQREIIKDYFLDHTRRQDVALQYDERIHEINEIAKKDEFLRNLKQEVINLQLDITRSRESERRTERQLEIESQLRKDEYFHQKKVDLLFSAIAQTFGIGEKGDMSQERANELLQGFEDESDLKN